MEKLSPAQILDAGLTDWRRLGRPLWARFKTGDFVTGLSFVTAITEAAEAANHHPDVTLTYPTVELSLISHDVGALTQRDVDLARTISQLAADRGIKPDPAGLHVVELGLDTADRSRIGPFWAALLTGDASTYDDDVIDPTGQSPLLWFQPTEEHETPRQRMHVDLWVGEEVADQRIAAAVAAGGVIVDDSHAPAFTVLADADGNRACVCTPRPE